MKGALLKVPLRPGAGYFDLMQGQKVSPVPTPHGLTLSGIIPSRGLAAFLVAPEKSLEADFEDFLSDQQHRWQQLSNETTFPALTTHKVPVPPTRKCSKNAVPPGMAIIPEVNFQCRFNFRIRECGFYESQPQEPLAGPTLHKPVSFERSVRLTAFAIDLAPVTNAQFAGFLKISHYQPAHTENFLKHWRNGQPPANKGDHPVVFVDLSDARAYAHWAGKRLPTEEEWQYAAQGPELRHYPWGNEMQPDRCNGGETGNTTPVAAYPEGRSPFGCYDMCGNTWEWTESEQRDERTRFCMLRGGSYYQAEGSEWYMDGGPQPADFSAKYLLMWPGLDRCATIGFRCVVDLNS